MNSYKPYTLRNLREIPQIGLLSEEQIFEIEVVGRVFPFKTNNYVVDELIDWSRIPEDPIFVLNFPQKGMLKDEHFESIASLVRSGAPEDAISKAADEIRWQLNPHPAGQMEKNVPVLSGRRLSGIQHKYKETVLVFPSQGQTCHAFCTFCFRWPQFVGIEELRFAARAADDLIAYLREHREVTDVLFTGGDPMVMRAGTLAKYLNRVIDADLPHIRNIRIGTKSLSYWPYRFLTDDDSAELLDALRRVTASGRHLALMAHFNHHNELKTEAVREAIARIRATGAVIRTQSPVLRHINDTSEDWARLWKEQVALGCVPYYMFVVRNTGAHEFFSVPLAAAYRIFRGAYAMVSGICRTVRGPVMSASPGKVMVSGMVRILNTPLMVLKFIQGRSPEWVMKPFFAKHDESALWLDDLEPAFGENEFFFEEQPQRCRFASVK